MSRIRKEGGLKKPVKNKKHTGIRLLISTVLSALLLVAMVVFYNNFTKEEEKKEIITIKTELPKNMTITTENFSQYFAKKEIPVSVLPKNCMYSQDANSLLGKFAITDIPVNTILTTNMFNETNNFLKTMDNPVLVSFPISEAYTSLSGSVRAGDVVTIRTYGDANGYILPNVYIEKALNSAYTEIPNSDKTSLATVFNIYLDSDDVDLFLKIMSSRKLYISVNKSNLYLNEDISYEGIKTLKVSGSAG